MGDHVRWPAPFLFSINTALSIMLYTKHVSAICARVFKYMIIKTFPYTLFGFDNN